MWLDPPVLSWTAVLRFAVFALFVILEERIPSLTTEWDVSWEILVNVLYQAENVPFVWAFFSIAFLRDWNENWLFQSCGHYWVFQICWHIECNTFTASSFRIWNSSTGIPSPSLALFIVMLSKAHLTSHSKMSGSRLMITSLWLSGSWRSFLYSSSVYSCHLFLISSASAGLDLHEMFPWYL